jgi:hypothetical protein
MGRACVEVRASAAPVHGGWGEWGAFSVCSRTCGGGVAISERRCDHPKPAHSGLYCTGLRKRFRVCNTQVYYYLLILPHNTSVSTSTQIKIINQFILT